MRYLITLLAVIMYYCPLYAGEVWVVKPKPASVWVVRKADQFFLQKSCPCSSQCVCGCNAGKECNCNKLSTQAPQPVIQYGSYSTGACIGGT